MQFASLFGPTLVREGSLPQIVHLYLVLVAEQQRRRYNSHGDFAFLL